MPHLLYTAPKLGGHNGGEQSAIDVLAALLSTGHPVAALTREPCDLAAWVPSLDLPPPQWLVPGGGAPLPPVLDRATPARALRWFRDALAEASARRTLARLRPDLLVVDGVEAHRLLESAGSWGTAPRAFIMRAQPNQLDGTFTGGASTLDRVADELRAYRFFISVSARVLEEWRATGLLDGKQTFVLPNCCREDRVASLQAEGKAAVRARLGFPADAWIAVCVASVQRRKGQDVLLEAFDRLAAADAAARLMLVGPIHRHWGGDVIEEQARPLVDAGVVTLTGPRDDALDVIFAADTLVLPTRGEALPRSVLEAMALGTPVAATDVAGIPELIEDGRSGRLVPVGDVPALVDALRFLREDTQAASRMAREARDRYQAQFSRNRQIERYREAVAAMLAVGGVGEPAGNPS